MNKRQKKKLQKKREEMKLEQNELQDNKTDDNTKSAETNIKENDINFNRNGKEVKEEKSDTQESVQENNKKNFIIKDPDDNVKGNKDIPKLENNPLDDMKNPFKENLDKKYCDKNKNNGKKKEKVNIYITDNDIKDPNKEVNGSPEEYNEKIMSNFIKSLRSDLSDFPENYAKVIVSNFIILRILHTRLNYFNSSFISSNFQKIHLNNQNISYKLDLIDNNIRNLQKDSEIIEKINDSISNGHKNLKEYVTEIATGLNNDILSSINSEIDNIPLERYIKGSEKEIIKSINFLKDGIDKGNNKELLLKLKDQFDNIINLLKSLDESTIELKNNNHALVEQINHIGDSSANISNSNQQSNVKNNEKIKVHEYNDLISEMKDAKEVLDALNSHRLSNEIDKLIMYLMDQNYKLNKKYTKISNDYSQLLADFRNYKKVYRSTAIYVNDLENSDYDKKSLIESVKAFAVSKEKEVGEKNRQIQSLYEVIDTINEHNPSINGTSIHEIVRTNEIKDKSIDYLTTMNNDLKDKNEILNDKYIKLLEKYNNTLTNYKYRNYQVNVMREWTSQIKEDLITGHLTSLSLLSQLNDHLTNIVDNYEIYSNNYEFELENDENIKIIKEDIKEISEFIFEYSKNRAKKDNIKPINPHRDNTNSLAEIDDQIHEDKNETSGNLTIEPIEEELNSDIEEDPIEIEEIGDTEDGIKEDIEDGIEEYIIELDTETDEKVEEGTIEVEEVSNKVDKIDNEDDFNDKIEEIDKDSLTNKSEPNINSDELDHKLEKENNRLKVDLGVDPDEIPEYRGLKKIKSFYDKLNCIREEVGKIIEQMENLTEKMPRDWDNSQIYLKEYNNHMNKFSKLIDEKDNIYNDINDENKTVCNISELFRAGLKRDSEYISNIDQMVELVGTMNEEIIDMLHSNKVSKYYISPENEKQLDDIAINLNYIYEEYQKISKLNDKILENINNSLDNYQIYLDEYIENMEQFKKLNETLSKTCNRLAPFSLHVELLKICPILSHNKIKNIVEKRNDLGEFSKNIVSTGHNIIDKIENSNSMNESILSDNSDDELDDFMEDLLEFKDAEDEEDIEVAENDESGSGTLVLELETPLDDQLDDEEVLDDTNEDIKDDIDIEEPELDKENTDEESDYTEISKPEFEKLLNNLFDSEDDLNQEDESEIETEDEDLDTENSLKEVIEIDGTENVIDDEIKTDINKEVRDLEEFVNDKTIDKDVLARMVGETLDSADDTNYESKLSPEKYNTKTGNNIIDLEVSNTPDEIEELDINELLLDESDVNVSKKTANKYIDSEKTLESKSIIGANAKRSAKTTINSLLVDETADDNDIELLDDDYDDIDIIDDKIEIENKEIEAIPEENPIDLEEIESEPEEKESDDSEEIELTSDEIEDINDVVEEEMKPKDYGIDITTIKIDDEKENIEEEKKEIQSDEITEESVDNILENFSLDEVDITEIDI